jgi:hypothetical protein
MKRPQRRLDTVPPELAKQLRTVAAVSVTVAVTIGVMASWDQLFPIPAERLVKVYRVHGCTCVFDWAKTLEAAGFTVKMVELNSLQRVRSSMHVPEKLKGCHVANYLGYFVEGHVAPQALHKLAREHPSAIGVVTAASVEAAFDGTRLPDDEHCPVYAMAADAKLRLWFDPQRHVVQSSAVSLGGP